MNWQINQESIFFKLNIIFALAMVIMIISGFSTFRFFLKGHQQNMALKYLYIENSGIDSEVLNMLDLVQLSTKDKNSVLKSAIKPLRKIPIQKQYKNLQLYSDGKFLYIYSKDKKYMLRDKNYSIKEFFISRLILLVAIFLLIILYIILRRTIKPIKKLESQIKNFGNGERNIDTHTLKKDEISVVANEFNNAVEKINRLQNGRKLFLRNILHELNTPITKGKILVELVQNSEQKEIFNNVFSRLDTLTKSFANIEKITSDNYELKLINCKIIDLIDTACDLSFLDLDITTNITNQTIEADFKMMSIVFKNLIDNAIKYGNNLKIEYKNSEILFISKGLTLENELSYYTKAFSGEKEDNTGFGLGLYIVNEVLNKHKFRLRYEYRDGFNLFVIQL